MKYSNLMKQKNYILVLLFAMVMLNYSCSDDNDMTGQFDSYTPGYVNNLLEAPIPDEIEYNSKGLPLYESNPGAPTTIYVAYDGGEYRSSSLGTMILTGYSRDNDTTNYNQEEISDILMSLEYMGHYFAMFDVNVTTIPEVRDASAAWSWIIITEEMSGGKASKSGFAQYAYAKAYCGGSTLRSSDKSRRIAHEVGHNFSLEHSGIWDNGEFYKWEDWPEWADGDRLYGPIMGGGGKGVRNGWANDASPEHKDGETQDRMEVIRQKIMQNAPESNGWRTDDHPDNESFALYDDGNGGGFRNGILVSPDDVDKFIVAWGGGKFMLEANAVSVSAALLNVSIYNHEGKLIGNPANITHLDKGDYTIEVKSNGEYGAIGSYKIAIVKDDSILY